tara:strand:- start:386 stop:820 length:435 start_codon:yes stop_codon:yes gene_type:complete
MFRIIKLLFLILVFQDVNGIHHHKRVSQNFLIGTPYFWNNRIIVLNLTDSEYKKMKEDFIKKKCEIINRKLKIFVKKDNFFIDLEDNKIKVFPYFKFQLKVVLIGIDGEIKYQSKILESFERYFNLIDDMPIRQTEWKDDSSCN